MKIQELMCMDVRCCRPDETLSAAAQAMWESDVGSLPVVDESGLVKGIITDRDLAMSSYLRGAPLSAISVGHAMAKVVFTLRAKSTVREALGLMREHQLRRLPVTDDEGRLIGLVTLAELAQATTARRKRLVSEKDVCATLAAITRPREVDEPAQLVVEVTREPAENADVLKPAPRKSKPKSKPKRVSAKK